MTRPRHGALSRAVSAHSSYPRACRRPFNKQGLFSRRIPDASIHAWRGPTLAPRRKPAVAVALASAGAGRSPPALSGEQRCLALFQPQQRGLGFQAAAEAGQCTVAADHAVAGQDDRQWIAAIGRAHRASRWAGPGAAPTADSSRSGRTESTLAPATRAAGKACLVVPAAGRTGCVHRAGTAAAVRALPAMHPARDASRRARVRGGGSRE